MTPLRTVTLSVVIAGALVGLTACGSTGNPTGTASTGLSINPITPAPSIPTTAPPTTPTPTTPTTPSTSPTPTPTAPTLITYPGDGLDVNTTNVQRVLANTSPAFTAFITARLHTLWKQGGSIPGCQSSALITLSAYRSDGYASANDEGLFGNTTCARGGNDALYAEVNGSWQEIGATQSAYDCTLLQKYSVPASVAGSTCTDSAGNPQPYRG